MKIIQDVVYNHTGNFGETNLCPMFTKEGDLSSPDCLKLDPNSALPSNYFSLTPAGQYQARLALMKDTDGVNHDVNNLYHHYGHFSWDDYTCQLAQIAGDCVDLNTENPLVYNYLVDAYSDYIKMGVDAFRVDTVRHISRLTLNKAFNQQLIAASKTPEAVANRNGYDFFMFGEVCCRDNGNYWYRGNPGMSTPFYTWKESKDYAWSEDPAQWETNYESAIQCSLDNGGNTDEQPTSTNALLNGNDYHTPDYSMFSGLSVIDFPMHWAFKDANNAFSVATRGDQYYNDATWNVTYVDSHDYAPDNAPESERFACDQETWAENLSLMYTFRGIPCIYYGSEIEFQKGCTIDKGPLIKLSESGRAYYGDHIEGDIITGDFSVFNASGEVAETLKYPLAQHIIRLNRIRQAVPALRKGQYSTEGCSGGLSFKRRYTGNGIDSFALVTISGDSTFSGIPNGTYVDAVTGDKKTVTNGTLTASCSGKGNLRVYVLNGPGRVVPNGTYISDGGAAELIGNEDINVVAPTGVSLNKTSVSVLEAETETLTATVTPSDATNKLVSWSTSDASVATVSGGKITGVSVGTATITASTYNGKTATCTVTVRNNPNIIKPTGITVSPASLTMTSGETSSLTATVTPSNATDKSVRWSSSDTNVATVNATGKVTAVKAGSATITATTSNGLKATASVTVESKTVDYIENGVYFEKPSGWGTNLNAYIYDPANGNAANAQWPGAKMEEAADGVYVLEMSSPATSTSKVIFNDGSNQVPGSGQTGFDFTNRGYYTTNGLDHVVEKVQNVEVTSVTVSPTSATVAVGGTTTLSATVAPSNAINKTITWTSSDSSVATVSNGVVTGKAAGTATITAKSNNGKKATATVTVKKIDNPLTNISSLSASGSKVTFKGRATGGTSPYQFTYLYKKASSSTWKVAKSYSTATSVSITVSEAGDYDVCIKVKDADETIVKRFLTFTITPPTPTVKMTLSASTITLGESVKATGSASGSVSPYQYAFYYKRSSSSTWTTVQKYSTNKTVTITPQRATTYVVLVKVKDGNGTVVKVKKNLTVNPKPLTSTVKLSKSKVTIGSAQKVTITPSGGTSPYQYAVYYKKSSSSSWTCAQKYSTNKVVSFTPKHLGTYNVCAKVKDANGKVHKTYVDFTVVRKPLTGTATLSATSIKKGKSVTISASGTGGKPSYVYSMFYKKTSSSSWTALQRKQSTSSVSFKPSSTGTYDVCVHVIDQEGTVVKCFLTLKVTS